MKRAIATIPDDTSAKIQYTNAIYDQDTRTWISDAEVAEVPFTAFTRLPGLCVLGRTRPIRRSTARRSVRLARCLSCTWWWPPLT